MWRRWEYILQVKKSNDAEIWWWNCFESLFSQIMTITRSHSKLKIIPLFEDEEMLTNDFHHKKDWKSDSKRLLSSDVIEWSVKASLPVHVLPVDVIVVKNERDKNDTINKWKRSLLWLSHNRWWLIIECGIQIANFKYLRLTCTFSSGRHERLQHHCLQPSFPVLETNSNWRRI